MAHSFTRKELYDLVWSEPRKTLALRFGISDAGLAKACRQYNIPMPDRGYWAKRTARKRVHQRPLPIRGPGMSYLVVIGRRYGWRYGICMSDEEILSSTPSPPVFEREMEDVIAEVRADVGRATVPKTLDRPHHHVAKLLEADEQRKKEAATKRYVSIFDQPKFDTPFEKRRLRLISAVFSALQRCGRKPSIYGKEGRNLSVRVNDQYVSLGIGDSNEDLFPTERYYERCRNPSGKMKVAIGRSHSEKDQVWEDTTSYRVEKFVTDIVVEIIVTGERQYRRQAQHQYEWQVERKAELIEEARLKKEEEERQKRERLERLEKERVDRLLSDADALRKARDIRAYVQEVKNFCASRSQPTSPEQVSEWARWALIQADQLDPVTSMTFLASILDDPIE